MLTIEQKTKIDSILSIFETGKLPSTESYSTCTILNDGAGISYGKHQSTDKSDTLDKIVYRYLDLKSSPNQEIEKYLQYLESDETSKVDPKNQPLWCQNLISILKELGKDKIMQISQDQIFDEQYWDPCVKKCQAMGLKLPLSYLVVYDTCIQSGPGFVETMRKKFNEFPPARGGDEKAWTTAYVNARINWLSSFTSDNALKQKLVRNSVYRAIELDKLVDNSNWMLDKPIKIFKYSI